jgi:hypothetical protein
MTLLRLGVLAPFDPLVIEVVPLNLGVVPLRLCAIFLGVRGALIWFGPFQRERMRSPGRKVGASAINEVASVM